MCVIEESRMGEVHIEYNNIITGRRGRERERVTPSPQPDYIHLKARQGKYLSYDDYQSWQLLEHTIHSTCLPGL